MRQWSLDRMPRSLPGAILQSLDDLGSFGLRDGRRFLIKQIDRPCRRVATNFVDGRPDTADVLEGQLVVTAALGPGRQCVVRQPAGCSHLWIPVADVLSRLRPSSVRLRANLELVRTGGTWLAH